MSQVWQFCFFEVAFLCELEKISRMCPFYVHSSRFPWNCAFLFFWKLLQFRFFNKDFALAKLSDSSRRQWSNGFTIDCTNRNKSIKWHEEMLSVIKLNHFMEYQLKFHWNHFYVQISPITKHSFCSI